MDYLPESYSSIHITKHRSYEEFHKKLQIWLRSSEKAWGYEKHETENQTILWAKSLTGTAKFIIVNKRTQPFEERKVTLIAGILTNLSIFRFTQFPLSLKGGWTSYFPRKFALNDFQDFIAFLEEDPAKIVHHQMPFPIFLKKTLKGILFTNLIIIPVTLVAISTFIYFTLMNLGGMGLLVLVLELGLISIVISRILNNSLKYRGLDFLT